MNWQPLIYQWLWKTPQTPTPVAHAAPIHGLRGLLYTLAPDDRESWLNEKASLRNIAHHLQVEQTLSEHWPSDLASPMVMKGFDYSTNLYPEIGLRHSNDIDLLVSPSVFQAIVSRLSEAMVMRTSPIENRYDHERSSAVTFEISGITLDVHKSPVMQHQTRLNTENLLMRSEKGHLGQCEVLFPHPMDRLLLWLHNFAKNFQPITMHSLVDLILILKSLHVHQSTQEWKLIHLECRHHGLNHALNLALTYVEKSNLWLRPLPVSLVGHQVFKLDRWLRALNRTNIFVNTLKGALLIHRSVPEGRIEIAKRLVSKLSD